VVASPRWLSLSCETKPGYLLSQDVVLQVHGLSRMLSTEGSTPGLDETIVVVLQGGEGLKEERVKGLLVAVHDVVVVENDCS